MLRTNTNKVKEHVIEYLMQDANYIAAEYDIDAAQIATPELFCRFMNETFYDEMLKHNKAYQARPYSSEYSFFEYWALGRSAEE